MKPIAIIGAGNGGCAIAAHLSLRGFPVHLCEIYFPKRIEEINKHGGIELIGAAGEGFAHPILMTTNLEEAIQGVEIIFWTIPANGHEFHARQIAPYMKPGQTLILTPGAVGGALSVSNLLYQLEARNVLVGETCTLPFGCRLTSSFSVEVYDVAKDVLFAMLPDTETDKILNLIQPLFPNLVKGETVLETSLGYQNVLLHPVGMILNAGWIEHRKGDFPFYYDGISPSVARILEDLDNERLNIVRSLGLNPISFVDWFFRRGKTQLRNNIYSAIHSSIPNRNFRAPESLSHRFVLEDVPFGLVPLSEIGRFLDIPTPVTEALIVISSHMLGKDFFKEGNTIEKMGISKMSLDQLKKWVSEGRS